MKKLIKIFRIAILVLCLAYIFIFFINNKEDLKLLSEISLASCILLLSLSFIYQIIHSFRFKIIIDKCNNSNMPFWSWFKLFIHTRFLNQFFPQSGNIYRGFALKKKFDISYTNYITSFASFAWMDTCFNFIIASAIVLIFEPKLEIFNLNAGLMIFGLTCITIISPYFLNKISVFIEKKSEKTLWIHKKSNDVLNSTINNMKDFKFVSKILLLGILAFIRTIAFYYVLFKNFNVDPNLSILVIFYALFKLSSFFIITPGNLGIQEIAFGFLSAQLGIGISEGILVCATGRVIGVLVIIILGISTGGYDLIIQERANKNNL